MTDLIGNDGLIAAEVGSWASEKHKYLCSYINISRETRKKYIHRAGATYIDVFCGPGLCKIKSTQDWIDGGVVSAWKESKSSSAPFTEIYISDKDNSRREGAAARLKLLGAPVKEIEGDALQAVKKIVATVNPHGLHFAFLDPYNLANLDFRIIQTLSTLKRIDILIHVSKMDLQRNTDRDSSINESSWDIFAPGWRGKINPAQPRKNIEFDLFNYWRDLVASLGIWTNDEVKLISGGNNQPLYWLLLAAKNNLAHKFWKAASNINGQGNLF